ncbi:hypothetical protein QEG98_11025 [Myxococcus sp. MxC21-1]|uniref:hypothetical protein n=1 Tax=Myxococcus sp. MxC21-1 TaxID=3041439 RepID=UPI0029309AEB|nr:hypothetical protein [Myxococcus sp. MxC21-1]WNZ64153.1 hypothetical protein QEG98_11025 [Myxococcus sp. MxC21-1]
MFLAEARLATLLQHQNIATVHDVGQGPEGLFLVMELVDGWDLGVLLRSAALRGVRFLRTGRLHRPSGPGGARPCLPEGA